MGFLCAGVALYLELLENFARRKRIVRSILFVEIQNSFDCSSEV
jgi:hypothetical protein